MLQVSGIHDAEPITDCLLFHDCSVPKSSVSVTSSRNTTFAGSNITLTCVITLDRDIHIDGVVHVAVNWMGPMEFSNSTVLQSSNGNYSQTVEYRTEILLNNISSTDSGNYICEAKVIAKDSSNLLASSPCSDSVEIAISKH